VKRSQDAAGWAPLGPETPTPGTTWAGTLQSPIVDFFFDMRYPRPFVDVERSLLRAGRRTVTFSQITTAQLMTGSRNVHDLSLLLVLASDTGLRAPVLVRERAGHTLDPADRASVLQVLGESSIAFPASVTDPTGRFARTNFPRNVDKQTAIALVTDPPHFGNTLPTEDQLEWGSSH
jgi:hypothetical protein